MKRRRRRPFVDMRLAELRAPAAPRLFLGRFEPAALRRELEDTGLLRALANRGYPDVVLLTEYQGGEHRLRIDSASGGPSLVDLRLAEGAALGEDPILRDHGLEVLSFLSIHWLSLQDPSREFTPERPKLPGQRYPGLGLARPIIERILLWATQWGKDGVLNLPEYYHNAVFYSPIFKFLSPVRQGRFEALRRDLKALPVAVASTAVDRGQVLEEPWGAPFRWEAGEMVTPLTGALRSALDSRPYAEAVAKARESVRFRHGSFARPPGIPSE